MPTPLETLKAALKALFESNPATREVAANGMGDAISAHGGTAGFPAGSLMTTGAAVDVQAAAPPTIGQVLKATDATHATWQDSGGGVVYKRGASVVNVPSVSAGGGVQEVNVTTFVDEGTILYLKLDAAAATLQTRLQLYGKDTFLVADLLYEAGLFDCNSSSYIDSVPFYWRDLDASKELHVKVINWGNVASTYTLEVVAMGA